MNPTRHPIVGAIGIAVAAAAILLAQPGELQACSFASLEVFRTEADGEPTGEAPGAIDVAIERIKRGKGPRRGLTESSSSSCDDIGWVDLAVEPLESEVGYRFVVVEGDPPIPFPDHPVRPPACPEREQPCESSTFTFTWSDEAKNRQEPLDFRLRITPVDAWGREGPAQTIHVTDPGSAGGGACSQTGRPSPGRVAWALLFLIVVAVRRRL